MKFLILSKLRQGAPAPKDRAASVKAAKATIDRALKNGEFDCTFQRMTGGGVAIANANSAEELWERLTTYPLYTQFEWHVEPLVDIGFVLTKAIGRLK